MAYLRIQLWLLACLSVLGGAAQTPDARHYTFSITLNDSTNRIRGQAVIQVHFTGASPLLQLDLAGPKGGKGMRVRTVAEGRKTLSFVQDSAALHIRVRASAGSLHTYRIDYDGIPADGLIIGANRYGSRTFFGDNWPDRAHQWLPCIDHPSDKAPVDFIVTAPDHYQVVAPGVKTEETPLGGHQLRTHWSEKVPLPSKVMVIGVADFAISPPVTVQGIPVYSYIFPQDKDRGFQDYALADRILPFYIAKIGPYAYEKLANVQSKTIFGGMENASAIFYAEKSVGSAGIEELMAHEIAHQWFGDAVTETDYRHLWLSEGFATYMTHLYMEDRYGADTLRAGMQADRHLVLGFARQHPVAVVDTGMQGDYMRLLNANSYQKGGWVLHMLRRSIGDSLFWEGIRRYYALYGGRNASTESFRAVMESVTGKDLGPFFTQWLYTPGVPRLDMIWTNPEAGTWVLHIEQEQTPLFSFPLEYSIKGTLYTQQISGRIAEVRFPEGTIPEDVRIDPRVSLLAEMRLH